MTRKLATVLVDAPAIEPRHLIHDGQQIVRVKDTYSAGPGRIVFVWVAAGPRDDSLPRIGTIEVGVGDTVQCVRVADWLAAVLERQAVTA